MARCDPLLMTEVAHLALPLPGQMNLMNSQRCERGCGARSHSRLKNHMAVFRSRGPKPRGSHGERRHAGVAGSLNSDFLYFSLPHARPGPVKSWSSTSWFGQRTLAERNKFAMTAVGIKGRSRPTLQHASMTPVEFPGLVAWRIRHLERNCMSRRVLGLKRSIGRDYNQVPISLSLIEGTCVSGMSRSAPTLQAHPGVPTGRLPPTHMSRMLR